MLSHFPVPFSAVLHSASCHEESIEACKAEEKPVLMLYYTAYCPYSQKVLKYLNKIHKQIPMKNLENNPEAKQELKSIGGKMQVPCLVINGQALYESDAIIEWLSQHREELDNKGQKN
jgi:glutaredoxin